MEAYNYTVTTNLINPFDVPLRVVSGELPYLNNKKIRPRSSVRINITVPAGYRDYYKDYIGIGGVPHLYVGWVNEEVGELPHESWNY